MPFLEPTSHVTTSFPGKLVSPEQLLQQLASSQSLVVLDDRIGEPSFDPKQLVALRQKSRGAFDRIIVVAPGPSHVAEKLATGCDALDRAKWGWLTNESCNRETLGAAVVVNHDPLSLQEVLSSPKFKKPLVVISDFEGQSNLWLPLVRGLCLDRIRRSQLKVIVVANEENAELWRTAHANQSSLTVNPLTSCVTFERPLVHNDRDLRRAESLIIQALACDVDIETVPITPAISPSVLIDAHRRLQFLGLIVPSNEQNNDQRRWHLTATGEAVAVSSASPRTALVLEEAKRLNIEDDMRVVAALLEVGSPLNLPNSFRCTKQVCSSELFSSEQALSVLSREHCQNPRLQMSKRYHAILDAYKHCFNGKDLTLPFVGRTATSDEMRRQCIIRGFLDHAYQVGKEGAMIPLFDPSGVRRAGWFQYVSTPINVVVGLPRFIPPEKNSTGKYRLGAMTKVPQAMQSSNFLLEFDWEAAPLGFKQRLLQALKNP